MKTPAATQSELIAQWREALSSCDAAQAAVNAAEERWYRLAPRETCTPEHQREIAELLGLPELERRTSEAVTRADRAFLRMVRLAPNSLAEAKTKAGLAVEWIAANKYLEPDQTEFVLIKAIAADLELLARREEQDLRLAAA